MKTRIVLFLIAVALLLGSSASLRPAGDVALAQSGGQYAVERGTISGGGYRLTSLTWQVSGSATGGGYNLLQPASATLTGSGCCCTYLGCILRQFKP
jgi:hypothetical protein